MSDNDWLKYNASEYTVNGKTYRNLEAQVLKNKEDIEVLDISGLEDDVETLQGNVEQLQTDVAGKQNELTAGSNITIVGNTISAQDTTYEAGEGIEIVDNVISATGEGLDKIFWVTRGTTSFVQVGTAISRGLLPVMVYSNRLYVLMYSDNTACVFQSFDANRYYTENLLSSNAWASESGFLELTSNKVTSVSGSSTDSQYPSAKCVYDIIANMRDVLADKADIDGYYEEMSVGNAEQLISSVKINDKTPYNFRTAGDSNDIGNRKNEKIVGGTVAWNQVTNNGNFASTSGWYALGGTISAAANVLTFTLNAVPTSYYSNRIYSINQPFIAGHKYLLSAQARTPKTSFLSIYLNKGVSPNQQTKATENTWTNVAALFSNTSSSSLTFALGADYSVYGVGDAIEIKNLMSFDLTQMFGSTIADYIYSIEQANAGAGVAWFKKLFPKDYYPYNAGELMSVKTSKAVMTGFNAYNHTSGVAEVLAGLPYQITGTYTALSLEGESVTPDANGLFTPSKTGALTVTGGDSSSTCVHLVWDGERNGEYEPYTTYEYPLDSHLELRGIPKLDANNNLYYDGDEYESDGKVTRRYEYRNYENGDENLADAITDGDSTVVKLATPTEETADPYTDPMIVNDWGTEEFVDTRTVAIPVGHDTFYLANLKAKLEMVPNSPDGDGDYIVRQSDGTNSYVAIESSPTIEGLVNRIPEAPLSDGTYVLKAIVSGATKTYSWIAE